QDFLRSAVIDTTNKFAYFGTYTSTGVVVKLNLVAGPPDILTTDPQDTSAHPGGNAYFKVYADGNNLTYQWQRNDVDIGGANSANYTRTTVTAADDQATFRCVMTDANGLKAMSRE